MHSDLQLKSWRGRWRLFAAKVWAPFNATVLTGSSSAAMMLSALEGNMDGLQFTSEVIKAAAWPGAVVAVAVMFKGDTGLKGRVSPTKGMP